MSEPTSAGAHAPGVPLGDLVAAFGGTLHGEDAADVRVRRFAPIDSAGEGDIAFVANPRYRNRLAITHATAVVIRATDRDAVPAGIASVAVDDPYLWYARAAARLAPDEALAGGIDPRAVVAPDARIGPGARIEAGAVVEAGATVGARARIGAGAVVGRRAAIGDDAVLHPRVVVYHDCVVGARTLVHAGAVIGADGFGFARDGQRWVKIPQTGRAIVGDDCEIGANTTIDRGALGDTVIGDGCKLDNQIQVAHNVRIGEGTAIAACVGIAGSATIGRGCMIGGGAGILGHLEVADGTVISAMSLVTRTISKPGFYTGVFPLMPNRDWERAAAGVKRLDDLRDRVRALGATGTPPGQDDHDRGQNRDQTRERDPE